MLVIVVASVLLIALGVARMLWRIGRGNEEMESGGSLGHQLFGRTKKR